MIKSSLNCDEMQPYMVVRLRQDLPRGTIVEVLDENTVLVEFADESGHALETVPVNKRLITPFGREAPLGVEGGEDVYRPRIGIAKGRFEMPDEHHDSRYPRDEAWENMPDVGLEKWPDYSDDDGEK